MFAVLHRGVEEVLADVARPERAVAVERDRAARRAPRRLVDSPRDFVDRGPLEAPIDARSPGRRGSSAG